MYTSGLFPTPSNGGGPHWCQAELGAVGAVLGSVLSRLTCGVRFSLLCHRFLGHCRMRVALINSAPVIHGFFHAGSGCCLQCTWSLSSGAGSRNAVQIYCSDSVWNFITFAFTRKENKDFHRPVLAERLMGAGTDHSP